MKRSTQTETQMRALAEKTGLTFDGDDDRIFYDDEMIHVFASDMSEESYNAMEKDLAEFRIDRAHYEIYGWNDGSGFEYWSAEGENHESNYIQVTASILNPDKVDPEQLKKDLQDAHDHFSTWDNREYHDFSA